MEIYIVRHGIAEAVSKDGTDEARELTAEGKEKMKEGARGFAALECAVEAIYSSPLVRARQTAEIMAAPLKMAVQEMKELAPGNGPDVVCAALKHVRKKSVMLVGHEPNCSELADHLLLGAAEGVEIDFKKGGACLIEADTPDRGKGTLIWHLPPKVLRKLS